MYNLQYKNLTKVLPVGIAVLLLFVIIGFSPTSFAQNPNSMNKEKNSQHTNQDWSKKLTPEQFHVLRNCGTEPAFSGKYVNHHEDGFYHCAGCGAQLFNSQTKYDSGSGWPSFYTAVADSSIVKILDKSHGMIRTEIKCGHCGGHLGHVFNDGPNPTGMRYCVNSASLDFKGQ